MSLKRRHSMTNIFINDVKSEESDEYESTSHTNKSVIKRKIAIYENCMESKRLCKEDDIYGTETSKSDPTYSIPCTLHNICTSSLNRHYPYRLIGFAYRLALLVLCVFRTLRYNYNFTFSFGDYQIDKFSSIVIHNESKSVHIRIENFDTFVTGNLIRYSDLFSKQKMFSLYGYFNSFVKFVLCTSETSVNNVQYLVIYSNASLDITDKNILNECRIKGFYPYKFIVMDVETCDILKDLLVVETQIDMHGFYQLSQDNDTVAEVSKLLKCSPACRKILDTKRNPEELELEVKAQFIKKLVFAVNQPNREELNSIIKSQMEKDNTIENRILKTGDIARSVKCGSYKDLHNSVLGDIPELSLLILFMHDMYLYDDICFINICLYDSCLFNDILVHFNREIIYLKAYGVNYNDNLSNLFSRCKKKRSKSCSINDCFTFFVQNLKKEVKYFIIYTSEELKLTNEGFLEGFYPLKFVKVDIEDDEFKVLKYCSCLNKNDIYQFSEDEDTKEKLFSLIDFHVSLQNTYFSNECEKLEKEAFLNKLIFAVNQPDTEKLYKKVNNDIKQNNVPYNFKELHETALRWAESHDLDPITKTKMTTFLSDIKGKKLSFKKISANEEEKRFAKTVVGRECTPAFNQFLHFLTKGNGAKNLEVLRRNGIKLANMSSILARAGNNAVDSFRALYNIWINADGTKSQYLINLDREEIGLTTMSSMLGGAGARSEQAFIDLYYIFFDFEGNVRECLKILQENEIKLISMSSILNGSGSCAAIAFKNLFAVLFEEEEIYLETLKKQGINFTNFSSILNGSGRNAYMVFKDLFYILFNKSGEKSQYLNCLEKQGIYLSNISSIISGAGNGAVKCFQELYHLFFDDFGNKTQYLKSLKAEGIILSNITSVLSGSGNNATRSFLELYKILFDDQGVAKPCLKTMKKHGLNLHDVSSMLSTAGSNAAKSFEQLYSLLFDADGSQTQYLRSLESEGISLTNISTILHGAGRNSPEAFKDLCCIWFKDGSPTKYLENLKQNEVSLNNVSSILSGAKVNAAKAFEELHNLLFDEYGEKSYYLLVFENYGLSLDNISSMLGMSGSKAGKSFTELYNIFFNKNGHRTQYLKHFLRKNDKNCFKTDNLSSILSHSGADVKNAFVKLHNTFYNCYGSETKLLEDFYRVGFKPSHLSCLLCGAGARASFLIETFHNHCFNGQREETKLLCDFLKIGFKPGDLCNILSGAPNSLVVLHTFCFEKKTKVYLKHFLTGDGFSVSNLCNIFHGARSNICHALKDFHDACYDESGNKNKLLGDFCKAGFTYTDLSTILSMTGYKASIVLKKFHEVSFGRESYLSHFLVEEMVFTPHKLSKILCGVGMGIRRTFKKLHDICFYSTGKITVYLENLIMSYGHDVIRILYKIVRNTNSYLCVS